jgi:Tol biopolymer transport system component
MLDQRLRTICVAVAGTTACCAAVAWAQERDAPISVGYRFQVFAIRAEGGARRVTGGPEAHSLPSWSPSGKRIAVSAGPKGVEIRDLGGRVRHEIRGGTRGVDQVAWSPDGRRIAFVAYHRHGDNNTAEGNLVVASTDGSDRRVVVKRAAGRPAWSRDGSALYVLRGIVRYYPGPEPMTLWSVPSEGGSGRKLAADVAGSSKVLVSPDGKWVLFEGGDPYGLQIVRRTGGGERRVTRATDMYGWAPGGDAVYGGKHKNHPIVTSLDGSRRVLGVRFKDSLWAWSPDGQRIVWVHGQIASAPVRVVSARPDGTSRRLLARFTSKEELTEAQGLEWSPDSRRLAIVPFRHSGD